MLMSRCAVFKNHNQKCYVSLCRLRCYMIKSFLLCLFRRCSKERRRIACSLSILWIQISAVQRFCLSKDILSLFLFKWRQSMIHVFLCRPRYYIVEYLLSFSIRRRSKRHLEQIMFFFCSSDLYIIPTNWIYSISSLGHIFCLFSNHTQDDRCLSLQLRLWIFRKDLVCPPLLKSTSRRWHVLWCGWISIPALRIHISATYLPWITYSVSFQKLTKVASCLSLQLELKIYRNDLCLKHRLQNVMFCGVV